jgi:hypothetical protein
LATGAPMLGCGRWEQKRPNSVTRRGVVQNPPTPARGNFRPVGSGFRLERCLVLEATSLFQGKPTAVSGAKMVLIMAISAGQGSVVIGAGVQWPKPG